MMHGRKGCCGGVCPRARVIAECAAATAILFVAVRFDAKASVDFPAVARQVIRRIGYEQPDFNGRTCSIVTSLKELPADGYRHFDEARLTDDEIERIAVKNQVTVFGFACDQTPAYLPLPIWLAHQLARQLTLARRSGALPYLAPDGTTQVGIEYRQRRPYRIHSMTVIASQTALDGPAAPSLARLQEDIRDTVVHNVFREEVLQPDARTQLFINPDGLLLLGGPAVHSGLTGRKNAIDTYGEYARHSGAALSGKDPTRIDRIGAYAARYAAKNIVAAGLAAECEVQLSYAIGQARPISIQAQTFGTSRLDDEVITALVTRHFDFRLASIIRQFHLRALPSTVPGGLYQKLAAYGHVGRMDLDLPWEHTDKVHCLQDQS
ncbi:MAG: methionine adenosyltransferase [Candidatus Tectimicrobiota bacterium]